MKKKFLKILAVSSLLLAGGGVIAMSQMHDDVTKAEAAYANPYFSDGVLFDGATKPEWVAVNTGDTPKTYTYSGITFSVLSNGTNSYLQDQTSDVSKVVTSDNKPAGISRAVKYNGTPGSKKQVYFSSEKDFKITIDVYNNSNPTSGETLFISKNMGTALDTQNGDYELLEKSRRVIERYVVELEAGTYYLNRTDSSHCISYLAVEPLTPSYDVKFYDGSTELTSLSQKVESGSHVSTDAKYNYTLPKNGNMEFVGWSTTPNSNVADVDVVTSYTITENTNFYAVWKDTSLKEITSFTGFTGGVWDTPLSVEYDGTKDDQTIINEIIAKLPTTVTAVDSTSTALTTPINVTWAIDLKEGEPIVGSKTFVGTYTVPSGYSCTIQLEAQVVVIDIREVVTEVLDTLEFNVAEGVDLSRVLPAQIKVKTSKVEEKEVGVTWTYNQEELKVGENTITGSIGNSYTLSESMSAGITAKVNIKAKTISSEVVEPDYVTWDATLQDKKVSEYNKNAEGDYIVIDEKDVKVTAQSTMQNGTTAAKGNAMQIIGPKDSSDRTISWIKFEVPFAATLKVRAGANSKGNRTFNFTSSPESYDKNIIKTQTHNRGANNVFGDDVGVVSVNVSAGTYYFWNATSGSSAQVYEIVVDKLAEKSTYTFASGEKLMNANALPTQDGYTFAGWVNPKGEFENDVATVAGEYAPIYYKASVNYDVRLTGEPGIKYCFEIEFLNGDALDLTKLNVNLTLKATKTVNVPNASYEYADGVLRSNAVVVGWNADTAAAWKNIGVTASIEVVLGDKVIVSHTGEEKSANTIANEVLAKDSSLADDLAMYL